MWNPKITLRITNPALGGGNFEIVVGEATMGDKEDDNGVFDIVAVRSGVVGVISSDRYRLFRQITLCGPSSFIVVTKKILGERERERTFQTKLQAIFFIVTCCLFTTKRLPTMGRSQVLYNRTKGRYKNRGAAQGSTDDKGGGGGRGREPNPGRGGDGRGRTNHHLQQPDPQPQATVPTKQRRTPKYDESMLLEPPSRIYKTTNVADDIEMSTIGGSGSIDIRSMAAAFTTSLTLSQRLHIPKHIAQVLTGGEDETTSESRRRDDDQQLSPVQRIKQRQAMKASVLKSPPSSPKLGQEETVSRYASAEDDEEDNQNAIHVVDSFSVDTRRPTKVRVDADGQVEVRNRTSRHQRTAIGETQASVAAKNDDVTDDIDAMIFTNDSGVTSEAASPVVEDRYMALGAGDNDDDQVVESFYNKPSGAGKPSLAIATTNLSEDDDVIEDEQRDYFPHDAISPVGNKDLPTPTHANHSKYSPYHNDQKQQPSKPKKTSSTNKKKGARIPKIQETESMLDDWLDRAMMSQSQDHGDNTFPSLPKSVITPTQNDNDMDRDIIAISKDEEEGLDDAYTYVTGDTSTVSSLTRSTLTQSFADTTTGSRCYTLDSRGKLFEDGLDGDDEEYLEGITEQEESSGDRYASTTNKQATSGTNTKKSSSTSKGTAASKKPKLKQEEELDDWLDSVIS